MWRLIILIVSLSPIFVFDYIPPYILRFKRVRVVSILFWIFDSDCRKFSFGTINVVIYLFIISISFWLICYLVSFYKTFFCILKTPQKIGWIICRISLTNFIPRCTRRRFKINKWKFAGKVMFVQLKTFFYWCHILGLTVTSRENFNFLKRKCSL